MRRKLLQLAQTSIDNPLSGSQLRNYNIACQLAKVMDVTHLGFRDESEPAIAGDSCGSIRTMFVPREPAYTLRKLIRGACGKTPATLLNSQSGKMAAAFAKALETDRYDIVQFEGIEMSPYLNVLQKARHRPEYIVLNWHNIESELATRHALHGRTLLHRLYMRRAVGQMQTIEREVLNRYHLHLVTSQREREVLLSRNTEASVMVLENGVDSTFLSRGLETCEDACLSVKRDRLLFVGSMDYSANIDAVICFVEQAWPAIRRDCPGLRFTVVGRNPPEKIRALAARVGVEVTGTVPDVTPYYRQAFAAVVPLRVGGGTRLKVLEAMAAGIPVVATTVGVEGLRLQAGIHFRLADSPAAFRREIWGLRSEPNSWGELAAAGRELAARTYDWTSVCAELIDTYCRLLKITPDPSRTPQRPDSMIETAPS